MPVARPAPGAPPASGPLPPGGANRPRKDPPLKPKRVRSGVKLSMTLEQIEESWLARAWLALVRAAVPQATFDLGLEYAQLGQTRTFDVEPGTAYAFVQGRMDAAYRTSLAFGKFKEDQWAAAAVALSDQAVFAAKLLSGELPESIDDVLAPLGFRLMPASLDDVTLHCSCKELRDAGGWCKHLVCAALVLGQKLTNKPLMMLTLRGMPGEELMDRVRQRRALAGSVGAVPVHTSHLPGVTDLNAASLDASLEHFWEMPTDVEDIDLPVAPPGVSHPLLRRLGPSPFTESRFPLVGLLATCYEMISEATIRSAAGEETPDDASENEASEDADDE